MSLTFLHTAEVHVATFETLVAQTDPSIQAKHEVLPHLLDDARKMGADNPEVIKAVQDQVTKLKNDGASLVVCTCSTIGDIVESISANSITDLETQRIDRAMADKAVTMNQHGVTKIAVVAALESTLAPTQELIESSAKNNKKEIDLTLRYVSDAWQYFEAGDDESYWKVIATSIKQLPKNVDVIVLAQASMANAKTYCDSVKVPILSSPLLGVQSAIQTLQTL